MGKFTSRHLSSYGRFRFGLLRVIFAPQECQPQLRTGEPLLQEVILYGRQLTLDDLLDDNEKEKITRDMRQLLEHYDHLRNFIDDERERFVISILIFIIPPLRHFTIFCFLDENIFFSVNCKCLGSLTSKLMDKSIKE